MHQEPPIVLYEISHETKRLRCLKPLFLTPLYGNGFFEVSKPKIGLLVFGESRTELILNVNEAIVNLWQGYVLVDPVYLSINELEIRQNLQRHFAQY